MKKNILLFVLLMFGLTAFSQDRYDINFINSYKGADNPHWKKVYLFSIEKRMAIDSAVNVNDTYHFSNKITVPQIVSICGIREGRQVVAAFLLDSTPTVVEFDGKASIKGSENNAKMQRIAGAIADEATALRNIQIEAEKQRQKYNGSLPDSVGKRLDAEWEKHVTAQMTALKEGITNNSDNLIAAYYLMNYSDVLPLEFVKVFLNGYKYKNNEVLKATFKRIAAEERKQIGAHFTDVEMNDMKGKSCKLSDYAGKGHCLLIDFWASWCGPCRAEIPKIKAIYDEFHPKGFDIIGISFDNNLDAWKKGVEQLGITWPQMSDLKGWASEAAKIYNVRSIPYTLLLDAQGNIIAVNLRAKELKDKLSEIYK